MKLITAVIPVILFLYGFFPLAAQIRFDPQIKWRSIESEHFAIHYPERQDSLARAVLSKSELYYAILTGVFHYQPKGKVNIVLDTSSDIVFGAATPFPNNTAYLNPNAPAIGFGHYDDWMNLLISHELTHSVDIDKMGGFPAALRFILGRLYFPGGLGPQWLTEGLATYFETALTGSGRTISPYHDMILRMAFLENRVNSPDRNTIFLTRWPGGNSAYVYGQSFYHYIAETYGEKALIKLRERYSSNFLPFRISEAVRAATGSSLRTVYRDWKRTMTERYNQQVAEIRQQPITASRQLTQIGYNNWSPEWSNDGKVIYFISGDPDKHTEIRSVDVLTGEQQRIKKVNVFNTQITYLSAEEHETLFYTRLEWERSYTLRNDIHALNLTTGKTESITHSLRASDPAVHPSGDRVVYITTNAGQTDLWLHDLRTGERKLLFRGGSKRLFFTPAWSPKGNRIALSVWEEGGYRDIWLLDIPGNRFQPLLKDKAWDYSPCWSPDGRYIVFSSDRTGVFNLFAYDLETHRVQQVTNVLGGAFDPAISPDGKKIAFVNYSAYGFDIHVMNWKKTEPLHSFKAFFGSNFPRLPIFTYGYSDSLSNKVYPGNSVKALADTSFSSSRRYGPVKTLLPRFYIPFTSIDEKGMVIGAMTMGMDVLARHRYLLTLQYGIQSNRPGYSFQYINNSFYPILFLSISNISILRDQTVLDNAGLSRRYWDRRQEFRTEVTLPFLKIDTAHLITLGLSFQRYSPSFELSPVETNPYFEGNLNFYHLQYFYSSARQYPRSISAVEGMTLNFLFQRYTSKLTSDLTFYQLLGKFELFAQIPGLPRHVMYVKGSGGRNDLRSIHKIANAPETFLRGYVATTWRDNLLTGTVEYRFPLLEIERSTPILPIFLKRMHGSLFGDHARFYDILDRYRRRSSFGLELRLDMAVGYLLNIRTRLGVAFPAGDKKPSLFFRIES